MDSIKIGKFILNIRKENNLSQSQFAEKLNVTSQAVSKWENGRGIPDIEILKKISDEFNVDIREIIDGTKKNKNTNKKHNYRGIIILIIAIIVVLLSVYIFFFRHKDDLELATISSGKSSFNIKGVLVSNNDKTAIYISNISYNEKKDEDEYVAIESMLYENINKSDKQISKYGNLEDIDLSETSKTYKLVELLDDITFNTEYYSDSCKDLSTHNFYITINALETSGKVIAYKIPLTLIDNCQK